MKFGILTFNDANNYGAVLQAYALNKTINDYYYCNIINYYNPYFHLHENTHSLKRYITFVLYGKKYNNKKIRFDMFRKQYMLINSPYVYNDDLFKEVNKYDYIIVGSDQVWNLNCSGNNDNYFLNFINNNHKKIAFSASFGSSNPNLDSTHIEYIKSFNKISVREQTGYEFLKNNNIVCKKTCDPVFLLDNNEWNNLTKKTKEKYILVYEVVNGVNMIPFAKKLSKSTGLKIKIITSSNKPMIGLNVIRDAGPIEWLNLIKNAEYVITNSFHGLAFSIIFNKQFYIELLKNSNSNTRIIELLTHFNLNNRIMGDKINDCEKIDYMDINKILVEDKNFSLNYIKSFWEAKYEK